MVRIEDFYEAASRSGLLVDAEIDSHTIAVDFRSPDESVLDGLALSADYTIRFPASVLPALAAGNTVSIAGNTYRVRDIRSIGDGSERRASLSRL
ncbi:head-tail joining protein [Dyella sp. KRB-257]|uniref:head-tail joining protein n=1 Tax=Dyella sp. KRB-257 TaxID=3400915 RepID=UPI003C0460C2